MAFRKVRGSCRFRVYRVWDLGLGVQGLRFRDMLCFRVEGLEFRLPVGSSAFQHPELKVVELKPSICNPGPSVACFLDLPDLFP